MPNETKTGPERQQRSDRVQSIDRAFRLLEVLAASKETLGLSDIAAASGQSRATAHRSLRTLINLGYVLQEPSRRYGLGPKLMHLGERASKGLNSWGRPHLQRLVDALGESINLAMLEGDWVVYVAHVPSPQSVRMFTEVGSRTLPHCTGVGKAMLAQMPWDEVEEILIRTGMPIFTGQTIPDPETLARDLALTAKRGYAIDAEEQEVGVRCVAVAVPDVSPRLALSVSGPSTRMNDSLVEKAVPLLIETAQALSIELNQYNNS